MWQENAILGIEYPAYICLYVMLLRNVQTKSGVIRMEGIFWVLDVLSTTFAGCAEIHKLVQGIIFSSQILWQDEEIMRDLSIGA